MANVAKVHEMIGKKGTIGQYWYDKSVRVWYGALFDAEGNQIGEAEHAYLKDTIIERTWELILEFEKSKQREEEPSEASTGWGGIREPGEGKTLGRPPSGYISKNVKLHFESEEDYQEFILRIPDPRDRVLFALAYIELS